MNPSDRSRRRSSQAAFLLPLVVAGLSAIPTAFGQISLVQVTSCATTAFPGTCTIPATGSGHLLVIGWQAGGGAVTSTVIANITDNAGNSYAEVAAARAIDTGAGSVVDLWYAKNSVSGATTVTITPSSSVSNGGVVIWEFAGASTSAPLDQAGALNNQASTATPAAPSVTTAVSGEVVISLAAVAGNISGLSSGSAFTTDSSLKGNGWAHFVTSAAGTYGAQWSASPAGTYAAGTVSFEPAGSSISPCDLNGDGVVNSTDVSLAVNMVLTPASCTANIDGVNVCNAVVVQRVVNASLPGGSCMIGNAHTVTLNWTASTTPNVTYNVYRGTSAGSYTKLTPTTLSATNYVDTTVQAAQTYYYVATSVDVSGNESAYSTPPVMAAIPYP